MFLDFRFSRFTSQRGREKKYNYTFYKVNALRKGNRQKQVFLKFSQVEGDLRACQSAFIQAF